MRTLVLLACLCSSVFLLAAGAAQACPPSSAEGPSVARSLAAAPPGGDLTGGDPFYYTADLDPRPTTTHSKIPHLPVYTGHMQTNHTFRFVNIAEQVFTMMGEGKHGLWRLQENGMIREYLRSGATGLAPGDDLYDPANLPAIRSDYSHFLPEEGFDGYKDPFEPVNAEGRSNFIDLPITHPKYGGKYRDHVAIDLPHWYCTMSDASFPQAARAMQFAFAQQGANRIGPLGRRAGLDIEELYTNVLRLEHLPDARAWVNVGDSTNVHWKAIDARKTKAEYYLYERPFFNVPHLFLTAVFDTDRSKDFRYVRPHGPYYDQLAERGDARKLKTRVTLAPRFHLETGGSSRVTGTKLYGVHHPNRPADIGEDGGGACPQKGGDWDGYPDTKGGSGWPTQYEEVTPLCDGVLVDIKFYANLDGADWNDERKYLANAGVGKKDVTYTVQPGRYGKFTDPYHTSRNVENPHVADIGPKEVLRYRTVQPPVSATPVP
jgi:hypothetical protein